MSILSQRSAQGDQIQKLGGKIRSGIKVLTNAAKNDSRAVALYDQGVAQRMKFSEIEKQIKEKLGMNNPMYPRNTPYFNVAASDFGMPEIANLIVETYGEIRQGDTEKRLYRFPVVFHSDDLNKVYPNEFRRYGGDPGYESHYGEDGQRYCRFLPAVTQEMLATQKAQRIKRPPRREKVVRGKCEPEICPEFLQGQCKFRGRLQFYIPKIPTTGLMGLETSSEYAAENIWADLERIRDAFGGIPRANPKKPGAFLFYITKVQEQRTYFDESGQKKIGMQWVPKLQADIDMGELLTSGMSPQLQNHVSPVAWLAAPKGMPEALALPTPQEVQIQHGEPSQNASKGDDKQESQENTNDDVFVALAALIDNLGIDDDTCAKYFDLKLGSGWENMPEKIQEGIKQITDLRKLGDVCAKKMISISISTNALGIASSELQAYATMKYGKGFTRNESLLTKIEEEFTELSKSPEGTAKAYITAQLVNAS